ncbi:hypothetical protein C8R44DRAFT_736842 [Mycena epipterygia]|nr:hypothetical protein C8R44DRAFT_736842 [Mycena epipterygia]
MHGRRMKEAREHAGGKARTNGRRGKTGTEWGGGTGGRMWDDARGRKRMRARRRHEWRGIEEDEGARGGMGLGDVCPMSSVQCPVSAIRKKEQWDDGGWMEEQGEEDTIESKT